MVERVRGHVGPDGRWVFEVEGEEPALDLANTLSKRATEPVERLGDYEDLLRFATQTGLVTGAEAGALRAEAAAAPRRAQAALARAKEAREAIYAVAAPLSRGEAVPPAALAELNRLLPSAWAGARLAPAEAGLALRFEGADALDRPIAAVLRSAAALLSAPERLARARQCGSDTCRWLFLDTSKNRSRRWCDMQSCGNRAKVRRHYEKHRD